MEQIKDYNSPDILKYIIWRDFHEKSETPKCYYCKREFSSNMDGSANMMIDHLKSKKDKGSDLEWNLVISCKSCNSSKGPKSFKKDSKDLLEFREKRKSAKVLDDKWVFDVLFNYKSFNSYPDFEKLSKELIKLMQNCERLFSQVREYGKGERWIEWNGPWYFNVQEYRLQPYFLYKNKHRINNTIKTKLHEVSYYCEDDMSKYIKPFYDPKDGINILKNEVELLIRIFKHNNEKLFHQLFETN